ncbi:DUF4336 domain-containing protein [Maritalea mediterranea]|uniref:DUF4336 domain-containing protein n=1 Tax=Maritalea mediterranea TaxID=2909667 RepID=A0ABS9E6U0_9HYPH|nr:DUF4336 domain-containing protein [Maritalea mediterranea]MCF4097927.1 DUF4336 domain-containing protein [Maritalea mediterranea]
MLKPFGDQIWTIDGPPIVAAAGFHYPTRMVIIRLADQSLFVWSPIELTPELRDAVNQIGEVGYLVAPNDMHHMFIKDWMHAYPLAKSFAAPGLVSKRKDILFDSVLGDTPHPEWAGQIDQVVMDGNLITKEVVFFHAQSGTVIFTDLLQQLPQDWFSGWRRVVAKLDLMLDDQPQVPRKFRVTFSRRNEAREALKKIKNWPAERVIMAHGTPVEQGGGAFIERAFAWLK